MDPSKSNCAANPSVDDVRSFWNSHPLMTGELQEEIGTLAWFRAFDELQLDDGYLGDTSWVARKDLMDRKVLEIGCGPGFMARQVSRICSHYTGIDLSPRAIELATIGHQLAGLQGIFQVGNAEALDFPDAHFDYVYSIGVIHHTPRTQECVNEIWRVLKPGGHGVVSVYHQKWFFRSVVGFAVLKGLIKLFHIGIRGRGRESMSSVMTAKDFVRTYDGAANPVGKSYTAGELRVMFQRFTIEKIDLFFLPRRIFPFRLPLWLHRFLARRWGLMINVYFSKPRV